MFHQKFSEAKAKQGAKVMEQMGTGQRLQVDVLRVRVKTGWKPATIPLCHRNGKRPVAVCPYSRNTSPLCSTGLHACYRPSSPRCTDLHRKDGTGRCRISCSVLIALTCTIRHREGFPAVSFGSASAPVLRAVAQRDNERRSARPLPSGRSGLLFASS